MAGMDVYTQMTVGMIIHLRRRQYFLDKKKEREELKRQRDGGDYFRGGEWGTHLKVTRIETSTGRLRIHCEDRWNRMYEIDTDSFSEPSRIEITRHEDFPPVRERKVDATGGEFESINMRLEDYQKLSDHLNKRYSRIVDKLSGEGCSYAEIAISMIDAAGTRGPKEEALLRTVAGAEDDDQLGEALAAVEEWVRNLDSTVQ